MAKKAKQAPSKAPSKIDKETLLNALEKMLLIRNFEVRAESAYQMGHVGGFFHSYIGQEAVAVAAVMAFGEENWYTTTYRCHAQALLLGATPNELMSELYGKQNGNAKGRGGSMHFFTDTLLGGGGIVGGHVPLATGAAFAVKYLKDKKKKLSICFLGDGATAQGAFHESLNLAALWDLPCIYIIENNKWGMGTAVSRALSIKKLAEDKAQSYGLKGYSVDGMDFFACYECFEKVKKECLSTKKPILIEANTQRFKGHSISDPGLYRSKDELQSIMENGPIESLKKELIQAGYLTESTFKKMDEKQKSVAIAAMKHADESPWPQIAELEEGVYV